VAGFDAKGPFWHRQILGRSAAGNVKGVLNLGRPDAESGPVPAKGY
jgi:hypothetical protein